ncbi:MAG: CoA pyrophosphatase [Syntrophomonadaceae bacterium]|nr:CoA pyrophosphatase [Syntrophomonadaceae bacterium]
MIERLRQLGSRKPNIIGHERCFKSAVLLPLVEYQDELCILFEERSRLLVRQPGEICFPGGRIESSDGGEVEAALREASEELGLPREEMEVIAPLDIVVAPFNAIIYPFLGWIKDYKKIHSSYEVESILYIPLEYLLNYKPIYSSITIKLVPGENFPYELIPRGEHYDWKDGVYPEYFYIWESYVVWGLTARILHHFLSLVRGLTG